MAQRYLGFLSLTKAYLRSLGNQAIGIPSYGIQLTWDSWFRALSPRGNISATLPPRNISAYYDGADISSMRNNAGAIPANGDGIKLWGDKSGNSATNAFVSDGTVGNTATTAAKSLLGGFTITADVRLADYTPVTSNFIFATLASNLGIQFAVFNSPAGTLRLRIGNGASTVTYDSTATIAATDLSRATLAAVYDDTAKTVTFYVNGVQLGAVVSGSGTLAFAAGTATIGETANGVIYRVQVGSVYDFNPSLAAKCSTTVVDGVNGTWTINTSGATGARISGERDLVQMTAANQPILTIAGSGNYLTFDGTDDYLRSARFSLSQPTSVYFVGQQLTWTLNDAIYDIGATTYSVFSQKVATPSVNLFAGSDGATTAAWALGTTAAIAAIFQNVAPALRVNRTTSVAGTIGSNTPGGFTLGAAFDNAGVANIRASEIAIYSEASSASTMLQIINYLATKWRISL